MTGDGADADKIIPIEISAWKGEILSSVAFLLLILCPTYPRFVLIRNNPLPGVLRESRGPEALRRPVQGVHQVQGPERGLPRPAGLPRLQRRHRRQQQPRKVPLAQPQVAEDPEKEQTPNLEIIVSRIPFRALRVSNTWTI